MDAIVVQQPLVFWRHPSEDADFCRLRPRAMSLWLPRPPVGLLFRPHDLFLMCSRTHGSGRLLSKAILNECTDTTVRAFKTWLCQPLFMMGVRDRDAGSSSRNDAMGLPRVIGHRAGLRRSDSMAVSPRFLWRRLVLRPTGCAPAATTGQSTLGTAPQEAAAQKVSPESRSDYSTGLDTPTMLVALLKRDFADSLLERGGRSETFVTLSEDINILDSNSLGRRFKR